MNIATQDKILPFTSSAVVLSYRIGHTFWVQNTRIATANLYAYQLRLIADEVVCAVLEPTDRTAATPDFSAAAERFRVKLSEIVTVEMKSAGEFYGWSSESQLCLVTGDTSSFYRRIERAPGKNPKHVIVNQAAHELVFLFMSDGDRWPIYQNIGDRTAALKAKVALENWVSAARAVVALPTSAPTDAPSPATPEKGFSL